MSLAHLRADLDAHLAARPVQPCPVADMSPEQYAKCTSSPVGRSSGKPLKIWRLASKKRSR